MPTPPGLPPPKPRPTNPPAPITTARSTILSAGTPRIGIAGTGTNTTILPSNHRNTKLRLKPVIYTLAFAAVTAMGTWYGAGLKIEREVEEVSAAVL